MVKPVMVQVAGQATMGGIAWYWLGIGVGSMWQVAWNGLLLAAMVMGWSWLDAYGLGISRRWWWAVPAVLLTPLMALHVVAAITVPLVWVVVLFPTAAAGRWKVLFHAGYLVTTTGLILIMLVLPMALLNWIPGVNGLTGQAASFGVRAGLAYLIFAGGWALLLRQIGESARGEASVNAGNIAPVEG